MWRCERSRTVRVSAPRRDLIQAPAATVWVSAASIWEIAIKHSLARADMPVSAPAALRYFEESGNRLLSIAPDHAVAIESLPSHHQDPFDRILIAQARVEPMRLITHDAVLAQYGEAIVLV